MDQPPATGRPHEDVEIVLVPLTESTPDAPAELTPVVSSIRTTFPGVVTVDLSAADRWQLTLVAERHWAPELNIDSAEPVGPISLAVYRLATLHGTVRPAWPAAAGRPESLHASFQILRPERDTSSCLHCGGSKSGLFASLKSKAPVGQASCSIDDLRFSCQLPAATLDLRLESESFAPIYHWGLDLAADTIHDLGVVTLSQGASVAGIARCHNDAGDCSRTEVAVAAFLPKGSTQELRTAAFTRSLSPNDRGFFQFTDLRAGSYRITAKHADFAPAEVGPIVLAEGDHVELAEPLKLQPLLLLSIQLWPETSPLGDAWLVRLIGGNARVARGSATPVDVTGRWQARGLHPGAYVLTVEDRDGSTFLFEEIELLTDLDRLVTLALQEVFGRVSLGDKQLAGAEVVFGGRSGQTSLTFRTDDDGQYQGWLPRSGEWRVEVHATEPPVFRRLGSLLLESSPDTAARLDLRLPDTELQGEVVDVNGTPVQGARVLVFDTTASRRPTYLMTSENGSFDQRGLAYGEHQVSAMDLAPQKSLSSSVIALNFTKATPSHEVRLVLQDDLTQRGRVFFANTPVVAAVVEVLPSPSPSTMMMMMPRAETDLSGTFELQMPTTVSSAIVTVMAPGYTLHRLLLPVSPGEDWHLPVAPDHGGQLVLQWPDSANVSRARLEQTGAWTWDAGTLERWALANGHSTTAPGSLVLPGMPQGHYRFCGENDLCGSGTLSPGDRLFIALPAPESQIHGDTRKEIQE